MSGRAPEPFAKARPAPHTVVFEREDGRTPLVSVLIPAYRVERLLGACLASVAKQTLQEIEVVVVEDGSPDATARTAVDFLSAAGDRFARAVVARHEVRSGPARGRATAAQLSRAPFLLLLDADNVAFPRCAERCLSAILESEAAFAFPMLRVFGSEIGLVSHLPFDGERLRYGNYIDNFALVRRAALEQVGGFLESAEGWEDWALWLTFVERGLAGIRVPEILGGYRKHRASRSNTVVLPKLDFLVKRFRRAFPWIEL